MMDDWSFEALPADARAPEDERESEDDPLFYDGVVEYPQPRLPAAKGPVLR